MVTSRDIAGYVKSKKIVIGSREVVKNVKKGNLIKIIKATNCPEETNKDLERYAKMSSFEIEEFEGDSKKLGEMCGKPFNVLLLGVKK